MGGFAPGAFQVMVPVGQVLRFTPEVRASVFHFTVFLSTGASSVYLGIWLLGKGITPDQIGVINALPVLVLMGINFFIGRLADKAEDWRQVIVILSLLAGALPIALFFVNDFWGILLVWTLLVVPAGSLPPITDAATVRLTQRNGSDFGVIRAWGTVGAIIAMASTGWLIARFGASFFVPLIVIVSALRALASLQLPKFRAPAHAATLAEVEPRAGRLRDVLKPWFVLPLVAFALINTTHAILGAFAAMVWIGHGVTADILGPLMATAAVAEALLMFAWRRIGGRVSARQMLMAAAIAVAFRWTVMAFNPPVEVLFLLQMLHAVTFAMGYFGMVHFIANWTSEEIAAEAQGFSFVLQQAFAVAGLVAMGWLVSVYGSLAFLLAALCGVAAAIFLLVSMRLKPVKPAPALETLT